MLSLLQKEKEMSDAKIDLRIAQREAKTAEDQLKALREEKQKLGERLQAETSAHVEQLNSERDKMGKLHQQIISLSTELQDMTQKEETARKQADVSFYVSLFENCILAYLSSVHIIFSLLIAGCNVDCVCLSHVILLQSQIL
jgi:predicted  nucleic acid-binding Zn-ribbon protein